MIKKKQAASPPSKYVVKQSLYAKNAPQQVLVSDTSIRAHQYLQQDPIDYANRQTAKFYSPEFRDHNNNALNSKSPTTNRQAQSPINSIKETDRAKSPRISNAQQQALLQLDKARRNKTTSINEQIRPSEDFGRDLPRAETPAALTFNGADRAEGNAMNIKRVEDVWQEQRQGKSTLVNVSEQKQYVFPNGDRYNGTWNGKWIEGSGVYDFAKQNLQYRGEFRRSKQHGRGTLLRKPIAASLREDVIYEGEWMNGYKQGHGKYYYFKDTYYEGHWQNNIKEGFGHFKSPDGEYSGQWSNNKKHGKGKLVYSGAIFEGTWDNDEFVDGVVIYSNGDKYEGEFKGELREGFGVYSYANNKTHYRGRWQNGYKHGSGTINYYNGDKYDGAMVQNRKEGNIGTYEWASGERVKGEFVNDLPSRGKIYIRGEGEFEFQLSQ